jgi:uncharacterized protein DUF3300
MKRVRKFSERVLAIICVLLLLPSVALLAQEPSAPPPDVYPEGQVPPPAVPLLSPQQLDNLVAPVALYPDALLGQVLAASTYPLEIVEAAQWLRQNPNLRGLQLVDAAKQQNWDPSVQAMVMFPDVLNRLNSNIRWTTDLGNAFLAQQPDVMNAVQRMRAQAQANGRLYSNGQETVTTQNQGGQSEIEIQPTNPEVVYVPQYNPEYIWGPPVWGYYPPLYYPAVGFGFGFYPGIYIGSFFGGLGWGGWGWGCNWFGGGIFTNAFFFNHYGFHHWDGGRWAAGGFRGGAWAHDPGHRLGVSYPNRVVANRFAGYNRGGFANRGFAGSSRVPSGGAQAGGWSRFGQPNGGQRNAFTGSQGGGWSHFGQPGATTAAPNTNQFRGNNAPANNQFRGYNAPATNQFRGANPQSFSRPQANAGANSFRGYNGSGFNGYRSAPPANFAARPAAPSYHPSPSSGSAFRSSGGGNYRPSGGGQSFHASGGGGGFHGGGGGGGFHGGGGGGRHR